MTKRSMFVGMDVHKESIDLSIAEESLVHNQILERPTSY